MKKFLKRVLPERLIWQIGKTFPAKPFLSDIANTERLVEYGWVLQNLPKTGKILDVGCSGSYFSKQLASLGYKVTGTDMRNINIQHPNFTPFYGNATYVNELFDAIVCISTLEHTALVPGAEYALIKNLKKIVKSSGSILVTVPCGVPAMLNGYKVFSVDELPRGEYFVRKEGCWVKSTKEEVSKVEMKNKDEVKAIACVKM